MNNVYLTLQSEKVLASLNKKERLDGRGFDEYRETKFETGLSHAAEGSARVHLGKTDVWAGIKMEMGTPYPDSPDKGAFSTSVELLPSASPSFEAGPPSAGSIELARVVDRTIRHSNAIPFDELVIESGEKVWVVFLDFYVINYDGNLYDASAMAAYKALAEAKIPKIENGKIIRGEYSRKLNLKGIPILTSFAKIGKNIVLDPSLLEDHATDARIHIGLNDKNLITAFQKGGSGSFTPDEINETVDRGLKVSSKIKKLFSK